MPQVQDVVGGELQIDGVNDGEGEDGDVDEDRDGFTHRGPGDVVADPGSFIGKKSAILNVSRQTN